MRRPEPCWWRSDHGQERLCTEAPIPSHVFFRASRNYMMGNALPNGAWKILRSGDGAWQLTGQDEWFATWLMEQDGMIGVSKACKADDRIQIRQGPLKDPEGFIIRVDRRGGSGQVELTVNGWTLKAWSGFELLDEPSMPGELLNKL